MTAITKSLTAWLEAHKGELRGRDGIDGKPGAIGPAGPTPEIDIDAAIKRLPPLYIGAKDATGKITMQAVPVNLGDTIYIRVEAPTLTSAK